MVSAVPQPLPRTFVLGRSAPLVQIPQHIKLKSPGIGAFLFGGAYSTKLELI